MWPEGGPEVLGDGSRVTTVGGEGSGGDGPGVRRRDASQQGQGPLGCTSWVGVIRLKAKAGGREVETAVGGKLGHTGYVSVRFLLTTVGLGITKSLKVRAGRTLEIMGD